MFSHIDALTTVVKALTHLYCLKGSQNILLLDTATQNCHTVVLQSARLISKAARCITHFQCFLPRTVVQCHQQGHSFPFSAVSELQVHIRNLPGKFQSMPARRLMSLAWESLGSL